jgi:hypothetical protein
MGWYTDVVVHVSILEEDDEQDNLLLLPELQKLGRFYPLPDVSHIYAGTTKGSHIDTMLAGIAAIKWEYPEDVQVWYKDEHDETFRLVMGVEEQDKRIAERDRLLYEAWDLLMDVQVFIPPENYDLACVKNWLEKYKQLKGEDNE